MDVSEKLQLYLNNKLTGEAMSAMEAELATDPELRAELALLKGVQSALLDQRPSEHAKTAGWDRLSQAIDDENLGTPANDNRRYSLMQVASVAIAAVVAWQLVAAPLLIDADEPLFTTASINAEGVTLRVTFAQDADMNEITSLLREVGGTITDGPSAIELYTIGFENAERLDAARVLLGDKPTLVTVISDP